MKWEPIDAPVAPGTYVIYSPDMAADEEFPGQPYAISNPEFIRVGNAKAQGFTHLMRLPDPPE